MKAEEMIKLIRSTDDEHSKLILEGLFKFGFVYGLKKGYTNVAMTMKKEVPISDADEATSVWIKNFL